MKILLTVIAVALTSGLASMSACAGETSVDSAAFVAVHNKWRTEVGIEESMVYSPALALSAQAWADNLMRSNKCKMRHSRPNGKYGENLYWASGIKWSDGHLDLQNVSPDKVVDSWGREKADYDYEKNNCKSGKMCGHYTQVVWRDTKTVGCGMSICEDTREQVWVCQYQPAGNWVGRKPY